MAFRVSSRIFPVRSRTDGRDDKTEGGFGKGPGSATNQKEGYPYDESGPLIIAVSDKNQKGPLLSLFLKRAPIIF